jgi:hypothetical protein
MLIRNQEKSGFTLSLIEFHRPTAKRGSAETPKKHDLIHLFQKPKKIKGKKDYKGQLTASRINLQHLPNINASNYQ